jgi:hypothetical protein
MSEPRNPDEWSGNTLFYRNGALFVVTEDKDATRHVWKSVDNGMTWVEVERDSDEWALISGDVA